MSIPWPSLSRCRLTTVNHFLCLITLFTALCRVGDLEPQPLIYKIVGKTKIKQRRVALLALWVLHYEAGGNSVGCTAAPSCPWRIGSRTPYGYQIPWALRSLTWPSVSVVPHLWIQPSADHKHRTRLIWGWLNPLVQNQQIQKVHCSWRFGGSTTNSGKCSESHTDWSSNPRCITFEILDNFVEPPRGSLIGKWG